MSFRSDQRRLGPEARRLPWNIATLGIVSSIAATTIVVRGWGATVPTAMALLIPALVKMPALGVILGSFLSPFDAYLPPFQLFSDLLWMDVFLTVVMTIILIAPPASFETREHGFVVAILSVLGVIQVASLFRSVSSSDGIDNVLRFSYFICLVAILPHALCRQHARWAMGALVIGTLCRIGYESWFYFDPHQFMLHPSYQFGRWTSNPNTIAGLSTPAVPIALEFAATSRGWRRLGFFAAAALVGMAILLSFSKSSWIAAFAAGIGWMVMARRIIRWKALMVGVGLTMVLGVAVPRARRIPELMIERWQSAASVISNRERAKYVAIATALIAEHPLGGVGLEQFGEAYRRKDNQGFGPDDPHNAYLHIAAELGLPALGLYLLFVFATIWRAAAVASLEDGSLASLAPAILALLVFQLFSSEPWSSRVFWVLAVTPWFLHRQSQVRGS